MQKVDIIYNAIGGPVRLDSCYDLFGAVSKIIPEIHGKEDDIAIHPIYGEVIGNAIVLTKRRGRIVFRVPTTELGEKFSRLFGEVLDIGEARIVLTKPTIRDLVPTSKLFCRNLVIKDCLTQKDIEGGLHKKFEYLKVSSGKIDFVSRPKAKTIAGFRIVGFDIALSGLSDRDSILIQSERIGCHQHMGSSIFINVK